MSESPSTGKSVVGPNFTPKLKYLLDNCLNPELAQALRLAGWDIKNVYEAFGVGPWDRVLDEDIIPWCAREDRVLVTADESARREHELALKANLISVLWLQRPKKGMSTPYQHAHLAAAMIRFDCDVSNKPKDAVHCTVGWTLGAVPKEVWKQRRHRSA